MKTPAFSIYNASAGSGKTYTLVKEYLKIILSSKTNDAYRTILAITFTNKAVFEMKSRIVDSLFDFSKDNPTEKSIQLMAVLQSEINLNPLQIKNKASLIIKNIIHNYAAFDISTIDKFTHKVIRTFAFDLGLPNTFDVSLDTEILLQEAVDAIVDQAGVHPELTKLLVDYTLEKSDDDKSWDISADIFENGKLVFNENNRQEIIGLKDKSIADFITLKLKLQEACKTLESENITFANEAFAVIESQGIDLKSFSSGWFPNHLEYIKKGELKITHKKFRAVDDIKVNKSAKDKDVIEGIADELIYLLYKVYKNYEKRDLYKASLKNITPLSLLNTVNNELTRIQEEQNILSISEFNKIIFEHIQNQPAPFIYERLGERYQHFFIDEFQDTSEMQWQNLIPLVSNALSSENSQGVQGSLLIVGDPKQSIYRWRGGKAEQFIALANAENPFSNIKKEVFNLETNYRSFDEVIHFNNPFFKFIAEKFNNTAYQDLYANQSFQKTNNKQGGYVNITFIPKTEDIVVVENYNELEDETTITVENPLKADLYLETTLKTIKNVTKKGFSLNEIVILIRNNREGVLVANYLIENNIPVISSESLLLKAASEVQFLLHFLNYLQDKNNKEALVYSLYYLKENTESTIDMHDFIYEGIQHQTENELEKWLITFGISISFENIRKKSLYEAVEFIVLKCIKPENNNAYVQFFLDIILEKSIKYQMSVLDFLTYWDKSSHKHSIPSAEGTNAVRIMTIHKSKGLEFPVVIFTFAEENYSAPKKEKMWLETQDKSLNFDTFLLDKTSRIKEFGENALQVYNQKTEEDLLDNINILYVALTRAEEQLYIISSIKERNKEGDLPNNSASFFIEYLEECKNWNSISLNFEFGDSHRISKPAQKPAIQQYIEPVLHTLSPNAIKIAQRDALMWGTKQQEAIEYGNTLHEIISYIKTPEDIDFAVNKALDEGLISLNQKESVENTLSEIINNEELTDFFDASAIILNEQSIIKKGCKTIKPDRVTLKNNNAFLLDYKTGLHQKKHEFQVKEYQNVLEEMGYIVQKKVLVYIGEKIDVVHL